MAVGKNKREPKSPFPPPLCRFGPSHIPHDACCAPCRPEQGQEGRQEEDVSRHAPPQALGCRLWSFVHQPGVRAIGDRVSECVCLVCCSVDPFSKKDWYDIKAPSAFNVRNVGKTLVTRTQGTKVSDAAASSCSAACTGPCGHWEAAPKPITHLFRFVAADCVRRSEGPRDQRLPGRPAERECLGQAAAFARRWRVQVLSAPAVCVCRTRPMPTATSSCALRTFRAATA